MTIAISGPLNERSNRTTHLAKPLSLHCQKFTDRYYDQFLFSLFRSILLNPKRIWIFEDFDIIMKTSRTLAGNNNTKIIETTNADGKHLQIDHAN